MDYESASGEGKMREGNLPPRPGEKRIVADGGIVMVEIEGQRFEMEPLFALSLAGEILATVEAYFRMEKHG